MKKVKVKINGERHRKKVSPLELLSTLAILTFLENLVLDV